MVMIAILVICPNYSKLISVRGAHVPLSKLEKLQTPLSVRKMDRFHRKYQKKTKQPHEMDPIFCDCYPIFHCYRFNLSWYDLWRWLVIPLGRVFFVKVTIPLLWVVNVSIRTFFEASRCGWNCSTQRRCRCFMVQVIANFLEWCWGPFSNSVCPA